ncbi:MAG: DNA repair protein RadC [Muribaculaceae bacterium]|nr:DNA repair protein RadC [Muribaculaceae bacterium]
MTREDFGLEVHEPELQPAETTVRTIKEMSKDERPRERAINHGIGSLTTAELLALILRTGQPGLPITELCRQLMDDNGNSLIRLERRSRSELMLTKGIGDAKALQVEAMMEVMRRYQHELTQQKHGYIIKSFEDIERRMRPRIANLDHEEVWIMLLNRRNEVIKEFRLTSGSSIASVFDTKMIIKRALLEDAQGIVMCHNHPSGNLNPSVQDDNITRKLSDACKTMDLRFLDHVILSIGGCYSYSDNGRL